MGSREVLEAAEAHLRGPEPRPAGPYTIQAAQENSLSTKVVTNATKPAVIDVVRDHLLFGAARASRFGPAAVVVARRGRTPLLTPPPRVGARFPTLAAYFELLAHRALDPPPSSSLAEERTPLLTPPPCVGARFPTLAAAAPLLSQRPRPAISTRRW
jgi:hypothetical protein